MISVHLWQYSVYMVMARAGLRLPGAPRLKVAVGPPWRENVATNVHRQRQNYELGVKDNMSINCTQHDR